MMIQHCRAGAGTVRRHAPCLGSSTQAQRWRPGQLPRRRPRPPAAGEEYPELELPEDATLEDPPPLRYESGGYTPFEYIEFSDVPLRHEVSVYVDAPVEKVYGCWADRLNWLYWFEDFIDEMGFHEEDPSLVSMYLWYRWAMTPKLELYCTLQRTQARRSSSRRLPAPAPAPPCRRLAAPRPPPARDGRSLHMQEEVNKYILEEPYEGMPLVAAVLFQRADAVQGEWIGEEEEEEEEEGEEDEDEEEELGEALTGTLVTLRMQYLLPTEVLHEFAGEVAVYGDVDGKLEAAMAAMKAWVEQARRKHSPAPRAGRRRAPATEGGGPRRSARGTRALGRGWTGHGRRPCGVSGKCFTIQKEIVT
eukprot:scaffold2.g7333.t1